MIRKSIWYVLCAVPHGRRSAHKYALADPQVYVGFSAGLAVFMFAGSVEDVPPEIEEAVSVDGCGPVRTFFPVVLPVLQPTFVPVGILPVAVFVCSPGNTLPKASLPASSGADAYPLLMQE